ncbi:UDP-glucose dehydrogenase family protein [Chloroflexota bacterium]
MKISIIGAGYVGLVTGVCLAHTGHDVICVDKLEERITMINNKQTPIYEPGLDELLKQVFDRGKFVATQDTKWAINNSDVTIVAIGTPYGEKGIDLSYIEEASKEIGLVLKEKRSYHVVCIKSTVVPTTTDSYIANIIEQFSGKLVGDFGLCVNPEFLREGSAIEDFMNPDRIVIGANDDKSFTVMKELYDGFKDTPILRTNLRTAEMVKYTMNSLLVLLISFSNEIANVCEAIGNVDVKEVLTGVNLDGRLNPKIDSALVNPVILSYLAAGCGFGGSCLPKDIKSLIAFSERTGYVPEMIKAAIKVNEVQAIKLVKRIEREIGDLSNKKIVVLGLAFKPETDDIRESPSIKIIELLVKNNTRVSACDPVAIENAKKLKLLDVEYTRDYRDALKDADGCILVTKWHEYENIRPEEFKHLMKTPLVFDGRRVYDKESFKRSGVTYFGVGLVEK